MLALAPFAIALLAAARSLMKSSILSASSLLFVLVSACQPDSAAAPVQEPAGTGGGAQPGGGAEVTQEEAAPAGASHTVSSTIRRSEGSRVLVASVTAGTGYHINAEFPWNLTVAEDAPVAAGTRLTREEAAQFGEQTATFEIPIDGTTAGTVQALLRMSVCNESSCLTPRETLSWELAAQ